MSLYQRHFRYDPITGQIFRLTQQGNYQAGSEVTAKDVSGYIRVQFNKRKVLGHRLAWELFYGEKPPEYIDHINGDCSDNRLDNLRSATHSENQCNKIMLPNTTGIKGIHVHKQSGGYIAHITHKGKQYTKYSKADLGMLQIWLEEKRLKLHKQYARH